MKLSAFGDKFAGNSGIVDLVDDMSTALSENLDMLFLGGGNLGRIPAMEQAFQQRMTAISADLQQLFRLLGIYQPTKGENSFRTQVAALLKREFRWNLSV